MYGVYCLINYRDFLTGFHKRKLQRKKKAKEKLEQELKEEKKRLKTEARESYKKLVKSYTPIPDIEDIIAEEYDDDEVNVKIVELSTTELAKQNNWIGSNHIKCEPEENEESNEECNSNDEEQLPGMELSNSRVKVKEEVETNETESKTKAEIKRILKKQATKNVQKSKAFQVKNKIEKQKQKKKSLQIKKMKNKLQNKSFNRKHHKKT